MLFFVSFKLFYFLIDITLHIFIFLFIFFNIFWTKFNFRIDLGFELFKFTFYFVILFSLLIIHFFFQFLHLLNLLNKIFGVWFGLFGFIFFISNLIIDSLEVFTNLFFKNINSGNFELHLMIHLNNFLDKIYDLIIFIIFRALLVIFNFI